MRRLLASATGRRGHAGGVRRLQLSPGAYRRITLLALVALGVIVVTGAGVRLTGSGLGCTTGRTASPAASSPRAETGTHGMIEFVNRLFTGVVSVAVILAVLGSLRPGRRAGATSPGGRCRWSPASSAQIVLGGLTVLFDLAPPFVMGHFLVSAVLVGVRHRAAPPGRRARPGRPPARSPPPRSACSPGACVGGRRHRPGHRHRGHRLGPPRRRRGRARGSTSSCPTSPASTRWPSGSCWPAPCGRCTWSAGAGRRRSVERRPACCWSCVGSPRARSATPSTSPACPRASSPSTSSGRCWCGSPP